MSLVDKGSSDIARTRRMLRAGWNGAYAAGTVTTDSGSYTLRGGSYKAVNNISDFLSRQNYSCGGPSQVQSDKPGMRRLIGTNPNNCDGTNIPPSSTNTKWVSDTSDYIKYKRQRAILRNYNDTPKNKNCA